MRGRFLAWLGIAALALGAWLSFPREWGSDDRPPLTVVLVDTSKSAVAPRASAWPSFVRTRLVEILSAARERDSDACVVTFASDVRLLHGPGDAASVLEQVERGSGLDLLGDSAPHGGPATHLATALALASTLVDGRAASTIDIIGDGTCTGADPLPVAHVLARSGVAITTTPLPPPQRWNIGLGPLRVPRSVEAGAPLVVSFDVLIEPAAEPRGPASVEIVQRNRDGASTTRVDLALPEGAQSPSILPVHAQLGLARPGAIAIEARVVWTDDRGEPALDAIAEDDASSARVQCGGTLAVGVVAADAEGSSVFELLRRLERDETAGKRTSHPWAAGPSVQYVPLRAGELAGALGALDAIVTVDAPLSDAEAGLLSSAVERGGIGWLDVAGWSWIAERASTQGPLASIAALVPAQQRLGPRDVILLADASGSMSGAPFESVRAAVAALLDAALPADDVEVRFFAVGVSAPVRITAANRADIEERRAFLARLPAADWPRGATHLWRALERIAEERAARADAGPRDALVILLSDGQDPDRTDLRERGAKLRERLESKRARLAVVAAGPDPSREVLESLLADGTQLVSAGDLSAPQASSSLAQLFRREIARDAVRSAPPPIAVVTATDGTSIAAELARATPSPPPVARAVRADLARTGTRTASAPFWTTSEGEPLGAIARVGSGLVASIAFEPASDWAPQWNDATLLAPIVRVLARDHASRRDRAAQPSMSEADGVVCLENPPADLPAPARARIEDGSGGSADVLLGTADPGRDPLARICARVPMGLDRSAGFWSVSIAMGSGADLVLPLATPREEEFRIDRRRFTAPKSAPGGIRAVSGPAAHPLAPWVLGAGMLLLFTGALLGAFSRARVAGRG